YANCDSNTHQKGACSQATDFSQWWLTKITNEDGRTTMVYWGAMLDELNMYREWLEARSPRPV
ncbi:hypothetical protein MZK40_07215, partial [Limosilactobacillus fermentum]